jgi:hypothetical protein
MKKKSAAQLLTLFLPLCLFVSCNLGLTNMGIWTQEELNNVFDLKQLGELRNVQGQLMLGDKKITPELMGGHTYGKEVNVLNLSPEALDQLPHEMRLAVLFGHPKEIQAQLSTLGLSVADLRTMQGVNGILDATEATALLTKIEQTSTGAKLLNSLGLNSTSQR